MTLGEPTLLTLALSSWYSLCYTEFALGMISTVNNKEWQFGVQRVSAGKTPESGSGKEQK